ncbi:DUF2787 family protein [Vibrio sp. RC27]
MNHYPVLKYETRPSADLLNCLIQLTSKLDIPIHTQCISISFRHRDYYQTKHEARPMEIQMEKITDRWEIIDIASLAYPDENARQAEIELYFNFRHSWFYQPDIGMCELHHPKVAELYRVWEPVLLNQIQNRSFNQISVAIVNKW